MPEYSPNLNIEKALGTENVNRAYFMRVIDDIDEKVGVANGLAKLDANGNVLKADGTQAGEVTKTQFDTHTGLAATTLKVGHVQLSDAVTSTDVTKAATSNAVKKAYDRADAAFTSASNGKAAITNAVTGADPRVVVPADPTFTQLATAVGQIQTGKKWATGTITSLSGTENFAQGNGGDELSSSEARVALDLSMLPFAPSKIILIVSAKNNHTLTVWSSTNYISNTNRNVHSMGTSYLSKTEGSILKIPVYMTSTSYDFVAYE